MSKISDAVEKLASAPVAELGLELWDVEFVKEAGVYYLRIYIDREGGVFISDCEAVSKAIDPLLDEADLIEGSYTFEVSSAGAERELKKPEHFARFIGSPVQLRLYKAVDGQKVIDGKLLGYDGGDITIGFDGAQRHFEKAQVAKVRLRME